MTKSKDANKRVLSKSAQKYRKRGSEDVNDNGECSNCQKHKERIAALEKKI